MSRFICILYLLSFFTSIVNSQNWESLGDGLEDPNSVQVMYSDSVDNILYVAGQIGFLHGQKVKGITRWNGIQWDSLESGIEGLDTSRNYPTGPTLAMTRFNNDLIVGGTFMSVGHLNVAKIARWNGSNWDSIQVNPFSSQLGNSVGSLKVINNELYVGGTFDSVAGVPCNNFAKWDGSAWHPLSIPANISIHGAYIFTICEYNGEIFVGGNFISGITPNDTFADILRLDGTTWKSVGGGLRGLNSYVTSMHVFNGELFVAGRFTQSDGNAGNNIQAWNGSNWRNIGGVSGANGGQVNHLIAHKGKLYVLGEFEYAGSISAMNIATWDGSEWCGFGDVYNNVIGKASILKDTLVIGGGFATINNDTFNYVAKWTGGNFVDTCHSVNSVDEILKTKISIFPNPTFGRINIKIFHYNYFKPLNISIYNSLGQLLETMVYKRGSDPDEDFIDLGIYKQDIYFIHIYNSEFGEVHRITKFD